MRRILIIQDSAKNEKVIKQAGASHGSIWEHGPMTVSRLIPLIDGHLHFNTISTVVRELDRIGFLCHDNEFRPFLYYPNVKKDDYIKELVDSISNRFFNGDKRKFTQEIIKES